MNEPREGLIDRFGATASTLCAIHCALCALLPAALVAIGLGMLLSHNVENLLSLVAVGFGCAALRLAWTTHRSPMVTTMLTLGVIGLVGSRGLELSSSHEHHGDAHHEDGDHHAKHDHHDRDGQKAQDEHHAQGDHHAKSDHHAPDDHHAENEHHPSTNPHHHDHDDDGLHLAGSSLGVTAGLFLAVGHLLNLRAVARTREDGWDGVSAAAKRTEE